MGRESGNWQRLIRAMQMRMGLLGRITEDGSWKLEPGSWQLAKNQEIQFVCWYLPSSL